MTPSPSASTDPGQVRACSQGTCLPWRHLATCHCLRSCSVNLPSEQQATRRASLRLGYHRCEQHCQTRTKCRPSASPTSRWQSSMETSAPAANLTSHAHLHLHESTHARTGTNEKTHAKRYKLPCVCLLRLHVLRRGHNELVVWSHRSAYGRACVMCAHTDSLAQSNLQLDGVKCPVT